MCAVKRHWLDCWFLIILQVRKGRKHTAEYKADKPLCGTWAEIDGEAHTSMPALLL